MAKRYNSLETKLIHAGEPEPLICGAVSMPVFQSSTFEYTGASSYNDLKYIRLNNTPNHAQAQSPWRLTRSPRMFPAAPRNENSGGKDEIS